MENFKKGLEISRNFQNRTDEETTLLHGIVLAAVELVQTKEDKHYDIGLEFLIAAYEPLIKRLSSNIYNKFKPSIDFDDIIQEAYLFFIKLVKKYNKEETVFSWYINYFLSHLLYEWAKKTVKHSHYVLDFTQIYEKMNDTYVEDTYSDVFLIEKEIENFINLRLQKRSRSETSRVVCEDYFLGSKSCSAIATDLNISYQAVYEIIRKIKKELKDFLHDNKFTGFIKTSTGFKL